MGEAHRRGQRGPSCPDGLPAPATRRGLLRGLAAGGVAGVVPAMAAAGCAAPWSRARPGAPATSPPPTAGRPPARLRLAVSREGLPALDTAVQEVLTTTAQAAGLQVAVDDVDAILGVAGAETARTAGPRAEAIAHRLLAMVQAGLPPDAVLLLGREAQVARFHAQGLLQDVSGLLRQTLPRLDGAPAVAVALHVVAGLWLAVPWYQRLVGHWARPPLAGGGPGADGVVEYDTPRRVASEAPPAPWWWGIGGADTPDVDAWCWGVIHAWGGGLADLSGERVALDSPETRAALEWLAGVVGT
jgi:hypothetical protein